MIEETENIGHRIEAFVFLHAFWDLDDGTGQWQVEVPENVGEEVWVHEL
jgi:hypothetical protein